MIPNDQEIPASISNLKTEYYEAYFGDECSYYLPVMIDFERGKKFTFNGWAFWLGMFWQLYRKLYVMILIFVIAVFVESTIENWAISSMGLNGLSKTLINFITTLIFGTIYGYTGNYFLMRKAHDKIAQVLATETDEELILEKLKKAGSGNSLGLILLLVFIVGLFVFAAVYSKIWG